MHSLEQQLKVVLYSSFHICSDLEKPVLRRMLDKLEYMKLKLLVRWKDPIMPLSGPP